MQGRKGEGFKKIERINMEQDKGEKNERDKILRDDTVRTLTQPEGGISDLIEKQAEKRDKEG